MPRSRLVVALVFAFAGTLHFVRPRIYEAIMPDYLPAHRELVYASGVTEAAGGLMLLHPGTRRWGGWLLLATLVGVFPANVWMVQHPERYPKLPKVGLWARLPLQLLFMEQVRRAAFRD